MFRQDEKFIILTDGRTDSRPHYKVVMLPKKQEELEQKLLIRVVTCQFYINLISFSITLRNSFFCLFLKCKKIDKFFNSLNHVYISIYIIYINVDYS